MNDQVTPQETAEILRLAEQCLGVDGDFVELGCYRGDTSVLLGKLLQKAQKIAPNSLIPCQKSPKSPTLCKTCGKLVDNSTEKVENNSQNVQKSTKLVQNLPTSCANSVEKPAQTCEKPVDNSPKRLWIYDSFAGLPAKTTEDTSGAGANFQAGELLVTKREVVAKLKKAGLHNVIVKKSWFNELTNQDLPSHIAFAFLDGDLYGSIKTSLKLVTPRLAKAGIMIVHDYNNPELPGSARAVDEWLRAHPDFYLQQKHTLAILARKC